MVFSMVEDIANTISEDFFPGGKLRKNDGEILNMKEVNEAVMVTFQVNAQITEDQIVPLNGEGFKKLLLEIAQKAYQSKESQYSPELIRQVEKMVLLGTIDHLWKDHLLAMDHLRDGIGLQGYGQKDPLVEYKKQGFRFFEMMMGQITGDVVRKMFAVQISATPPEREEMSFEDDSADEHHQQAHSHQSQPLPSGPIKAADALGGRKPLPRGIDLSKVGRNDDCPCGSGKKFKKCHG
jgi:preprotein translocase subunit SecA